MPLSSSPVPPSPMPSSLSEVLKRTPPPYQPRDQVELLATEITREVCRTIPMMQRLGVQDEEIQQRLRRYVQQQLIRFAAVKKTD